MYNTLVLKTMTLYHPYIHKRSTYLNVVLVAILYQQCSTLFLIMCLSPTLYQNITIIKTIQYVYNVSCMKGLSLIYF